ncbi:MAG: hypothetical protein ABJC79_11805 [Acidimicrobiia bacterium]
MDRARRLLGILIVFAVAGAVVLVVVVRPGLRDDAETVDRSWSPLVGPLDARYQALGAVIPQLKTSGAGNRAATLGLVALLDRWQVVRTGTDSEDQVRTANRIEATAARVGALIRTARLIKLPALQETFATFTKSRPNTTVLDHYTRAANTYESRRDGFWNRIVAGLDGYSMQPTLQLVS